MASARVKALSEGLAILRTELLTTPKAEQLAKVQEWLRAQRPEDQATSPVKFGDSPSCAWSVS